MVQNYETRGKIAVIQDQIDGAVEAFRAGDMVSTIAILRSVGPMIEDLLRLAPKAVN